MSGAVGQRRDCAIKAALTLALMTLGSLAMLLVAIVTGFQARRLCAQGIAAPLGRLTLRLWGVRLVVHDAPAEVPEQRVYISNHTSTLDVFVLIALGLPNTRFFLSGFLRKLPPLGLMGYLMGIFWTVAQEFPERRVAIFQRAARILKRTGESVYLSPEGARITTGDIGHFNRGAFHLATDLGAPIVPFFIVTPAEVDPGMGYCAGAGQVDVYFKPVIDTRGWRVADVNANKERVRDRFTAWNEAYRRA